MAEGKKGDKTEMSDTGLGDAMDEPTAAMDERKLMKEEAKKAKKEGRNAAGQDGIPLVHTTKNSTYVFFIVNANKVQIGNQNTITTIKGAKQAQEKESSSSSEEQEGDEEGEEEECHQEKPKIYQTLIHHLGLTDADIDQVELDYKVVGAKEVHQGLLKWTKSEH